MSHSKTDRPGKSDRRLSAAEQRRLDHFQNVCDRMAATGYEREVLTISPVLANVVVIVAAVPLAFLTFWLYRTFAPATATDSLEVDLGLPLILAALALVFAHELIHGLTWAIFSQNHLHDIEFGMMWKYLMPYCTCKTPLELGPYVLGGLAPLVLLGILPMALGIATGSLFVTILGAFMALSAAGDVMIVTKLLRFRTNACEVVIFDHPTEAGSVIFTR